MELPEAPLRETKRGYMEQSGDQRNPEIPPKPALEIQIIPKDLEELCEKGYMKDSKQRSIKGTRRRKPGRRKPGQRKC